jgi:hypothetical protein
MGYINLVHGKLQLQHQCTILSLYLFHSLLKGFQECDECLFFIFTQVHAEIMAFHGPCCYMGGFIAGRYIALFEPCGVKYVFQGGQFAMVEEGPRYHNPLRDGTLKYPVPLRPFRAEVGSVSTEMLKISNLSKCGAGGEAPH